MKKALIFAVTLLALVLFFLAACGPVAPQRVPEALPEALPTATHADASTTTPTATRAMPSPTVTSSRTRRPVETDAPTATPQPVRPAASPTPKPTLEMRPPAQGLQTKGPYLMYSRALIESQPWYRDETPAPTTLMAMDADGSGQVSFTLPQGGYLTRLGSFSPDGQWLVYHTGNPAKMDEDGKYQYALHLYQWRTGKDIKIADLLPPNYPENFGVTAKMLRASDPKQWEGMNLVENLQMIFLQGIDSAAWSPDGRYLAFAGAMDGPSSDLYLYVLSTGEVRRLTDGPAQIEWLIWTPDSQKIFHYSAYNGCEGECGTYHVAQIDGKAWTLKDVNSHGGVNIFGGWVSNNQMAMFSHSNGPRGPLRYFNIDTGEDVVYFDVEVENATYDRELRQWLVNVPNSQDPNYPPGLYQLDASTKQAKWISPKTCYQIFFLGHPKTRFFAYCGEHFGDGILTFVQRDGTLVDPVDAPVIGIHLLEESPDKQWFATADNRRIRLFDMTGKTQYEMDITNVSALIWRPDSQGFYFVAPTEWNSANCLYYFSIADQRVIRLDEDIQKESSSYGPYWPYQWVK